MDDQYLVSSSSCEEWATEGHSVQENIQVEKLRHPALQILERLKGNFALSLYNKLWKQDITGRNGFGLDFVQVNHFPDFRHLLLKFSNKNVKLNCNMIISLFMSAHNHHVIWHLANFSQFKEAVVLNSFSQNQVFFSYQKFQFLVSLFNLLLWNFSKCW